MSDVKLPSHEEIHDAVMGKPIDILARLPECTESRRAGEHLDLAKQYMHEAREKQKPR